MVDLEQFGSRIPDAWSVTFIFSLMGTFYHTKTKNRAQNLKRNSHTIVLSKGNVFSENAEFSKKNADFTKINRVLVLKIIFSDTRYVKLDIYLYLRTKF